MIILVVLAAASLSTAASLSCASTPLSASDYACVAVDVLQQRWWEPIPAKWKDTGFWNCGNSLEVVCNFCLYENRTDLLEEINAVHERRPADVVEAFANGSWDDSQWWVLAYLRGYELTGKDSFLRDAKTVFDHVWEKAWDTGTCGGGMWWSSKNSYKNAITNELAIMSAAKLYRLTNESVYQQRAWTAWRWFEQSGMINGDSLINDGLDAHCKNNGGNTWTYNQGVILGGLAELSVIYKNSTLVHIASDIAAAVQAHLTTPEGILHEPNYTGGRDGEQFKGIYVRYLHYMSKLVPSDMPQQPTWRNFLRTQSTAVWTHARNTTTNCFGVLWEGPPSASPPAPTPQTSAIDAFLSAL